MACYFLADCPNCESDQSNVRCECDACGLKGCGDCLPATPNGEGIGDYADYVRYCATCAGRKG